MTRPYAKRVIAAKAKEIMRTESHGYGMALHVDGVTRTWQCGESLSDSTGVDVTEGLDGELRMATLIMHGRTSTSSDHSVRHSHPRPTGIGPLMHNGVVRPLDVRDWDQSHDLDTDYLAELASRDDLHNAASYLAGYAAVLWLKDDGSLVVQNQGASLNYRIESDTVEFGTTHALCGGSKFSSMRCESLDCRLSIVPLPEMSGRSKHYNSSTDIGVSTPKAEGAQWPPTQAKTESSSQSTSGSSAGGGRTSEQMGPNPKKKGRFHLTREQIDSMSAEEIQTSFIEWRNA